MLGMVRKYYISGLASCADFQIQVAATNKYTEKAIVGKTGMGKISATAETNKTNSMAFTTSELYQLSDATCRRNLVPTFADRGVLCGQRGRFLTVVNLSFLNQSHYLFFKAAPHLSSRG
jgi:hypothetical protein